MTAAYRIQLFLLCTPVAIAEDTTSPRAARASSSRRFYYRQYLTAF